MRVKAALSVFLLGLILVVLLYSCDAIGILNRAPISDAGPDQTTEVGTEVMLDGGKSRDPDGDPLTYDWSFSSKPSASQLTNADISGSSSTVAYFTPDAAGTYDVSLAVNDGSAAHSDTTRVVAEEGDTDDPADTTPPSVASVTPADGSTGVAVTNAVSVTFSEQMETTATEGAFSLDAGGTPVAGSCTWSGTTMTFTPDADLAYETDYAITVTTDAEDTSGNGLADAFSSAFTTAAGVDTTAPEIIDVSPADGAGAVPVTTDVSVTFSEAMDTDSTEAAFSLEVDGAAVSGSFSWSGSTMTFAPDGALADETVHDVAVTTAASDISGNSLEQGFSASFTTVSSAVPSASFTYTPSDPVAGEVITFDGSDSSDPAGLDLTYSWDTDGDGTEDYAGETIDLYFNTVNDYEVTLTVANTMDASNSTAETVTVDESIVVAGFSYDDTSGDADACVARYTTDLQRQVWLEKFDGGSGDDGVNDIAIDADGNLHAVGWQWNGTNKDIWILKLSPDGGMLEEDVTGTPDFHDNATSAVVSGTSLYATGVWHTENYPNTHSNRWVAKYDTVSLQLQKDINDQESMHDIFYAIDVNSAGEVFIAGDNHPSWEWRIEKFDADLNEITDGWDMLFQPNGDGAAYAARVGPNDHLLVAGFSDVETDNAAWYLFEYDESGAELWSTYYDLTNERDTPYDIAIDQENQVYVAGGAGTTSTYWAVKAYDDASPRQEKWEYTFDSGNGSECAKGAVVYGSSLYVAGAQRNAAGDTDAAIRILDRTDGSYTDERILNDSSGDDYWNAILVDRQGSLQIIAY